MKEFKLVNQKEVEGFKFKIYTFGDYELGIGVSKGLGEGNFQR